MQEVEGRLCYKRIASFDLNLGNFDPNALLANNPVLATKEENKAQKYAEVASTGTPVSSVLSSDGMAKWFYTTSTNKSIEVFEGDKIIQSKFGQSIRFSGFWWYTRFFTNNYYQKQLRNQQTNDLDEKTPTTENFQDDGSIMIIGNEQKLPYTQDFLVSQISRWRNIDKEFTENTYPSEFIGDNLLIKSDKLFYRANQWNDIFI